MNGAPDTAAAGGDRLASLVVFDRLEVDPPRIEPRRLVAPYRLVGGGRASATELIFRFEEAVFDPADGAVHNLASMMTAQVALNYGLFCRQIVLNGTFDPLDRRFLRAMAENTAREIYVKKFLSPNPFLRAPWRALPAQRRSRYLAASLVFPQAARGRGAGAWQLWATRHDRAGVLSSGGKDSLLSFGLIDEIAAARGGEVHPILVNEAGRHWFTALNAYRHFRDHVPHTARVWVNADRVFAWMLRQMPFVRPDFADRRADDYPIRLWTVAVFLFAVLPLLKKRGIGRLLIGDEFDTSRRESFEGIRHYDGLFDQSVWFDQTLSYYFLQKGWSGCQFSVLRPLSELLIQKTLAARYPALLPLQMSCHATHSTGKQVRPCGRCEKCRRIVGMLLAVGADPAACGYDTGQVAHVLDRMDPGGLHQEAACAQHTLHLLARAGRIEAAGPGAQPHPEVLQLRFDPEIAPLTGIPVDLRRPLLKILLAHADGAVQRRGRRWTAFDPLTAADLSAPYAFESESPAAGPEPDAQSSDWGALTWPEAAERIKAVDIALLPVGSCEQHGPHLPLDTDAFDARYLCARVAAACNPPPLVLPLIPYGVSYHHSDFPGTIDIGNATLSQLVYDVGRAAARNGIRKLVIINGHCGNAPALDYAAQMIHRDTGIFVCVDTGETSDVDVAAIDTEHFDAGAPPS